MQRPHSLNLLHRLGIQIDEVAPSHFEHALKKLDQQIPESTKNPGEKISSQLRLRL